MFAISEQSQGENSDSVLGARAVLAGKALGLSTWLDKPAALVRKVRSDYPVPSVSELASLAKKNKRSLVKSRLDDAMKAGVPKKWLSELAQESARCAVESIKDGDGRGSYGSPPVKNFDPLNSWGVRFALDCALHSMGWASGKGPLDELKRSGAVSSNVFAKVHSAFEAGQLDSLASQGAPDAKGNLRI